MIEPLYYLCAFLCAVAFVCWQAGEIYELRQELRVLKQAEVDDLNARDAWANRQEGAA